MEGVKFRAAVSYIKGCSTGYHNYVVQCHVSLDGLEVLEYDKIPNGYDIQHGGDHRLGGEYGSWILQKADNESSSRGGVQLAKAEGLLTLLGPEGGHSAGLQGYPSNSVSCLIFDNEIGIREVEGY
jgi:hypothetical protein